MKDPNNKHQMTDLLRNHKKVIGKEREFGFERGRRESFAQA